MSNAKPESHIETMYELETLSDEEYAAYLRDEESLSWMSDGLPTTFKTSDPLTWAAQDAAIRAMGLQTFDDLLAELGPSLWPLA